MKKLLDPKWILLANTLPIALFILIGWNEFSIIESMLESSNLAVWYTFFVALLTLSACTLAYAIIKIIRKEQIDIIYCVATLVVYTLYTYLYYDNSDNLIPWEIPDWMLSGNLDIYAGMFIMPTLLHSLFVSVILLTPDAKNKNGWTNLASAVGIPILFYMFGLLLSPLWRKSHTIGSTHFFFVLIIAATVAFLFFLVRGIYILSKKKHYSEQNLILGKIIVTILLPMTGLAVNMTMSNIFGDFSSVWFLAVALVTGILLCLPSPSSKKLKLLLFAARCAMLSYTLYFFFVFLPFIPLAVVAIIILGAGLLMLTPLVLFIIHFNQLTVDFAYLKRFYSKSIIYAVAAGSFLTLPTALTLSYMYDKMMMQRSLDYLYSTDYSKEYDIDPSSVMKSIDMLNQRVSRGDHFYSSTPFLSNYYKWLVLDNMNLSQTKKDLITNVFKSNDPNEYKNRTSFSDSTNSLPVQESTDTTRIRITGIEHTSQYNAGDDTWSSWINMEITNYGTPLWNAEYITEINLPEGCWISDYYLYVGHVKEMGILAEKKAATWVFDQIRNVNRDPGVLRYTTGNKVQFKVFPFEKKETRLTGIQFVHKEPVTINIDGYAVELGDKSAQNNSIAKSTKTADGKAVYVSTDEKEQLPLIERRPYYHFVADLSAGTQNKAQQVIDNIEKFTAKGLIDSNNAKISLTGTFVHTIDMDDHWQDKVKDYEQQGGFFLDMAVKKILADAYTHPSEMYPVIVVISSDMNNWLIYNDFSDLIFALPDNSTMYWYNNDQLISYNLSDLYPTTNQPDSEWHIPTNKVRAWPSLTNATAYLPDDGKPSIVLVTTAKTPTDNNAYNAHKTTEKNWQTGLEMQAQWMQQKLRPETIDDEWLPLIQKSFGSKIMSPLTSYIVVENEAQKAMLKKKQEIALSGKHSLDLTDDTPRMSEPNLYVILGFLILIYILRRMRSYQNNNKSGNKKQYVNFYNK